MDFNDSSRMCCLESPVMKSTIKGHIQYIDWVKSLESQAHRVSFGIRKRPEGWSHPPREASKAVPNCQLMKSILKNPLSNGRKKAQTSSKDSIEKDIQIDPHHKISIAVSSRDDLAAIDGNQHVYFELFQELIDHELDFCGLS